MAEHAEIVRAVRKGDSEAIQTALHRNWVGGLQRIEGLIELFGERGSW